MKLELECCCRCSCSATSWCEWTEQFGAAQCSVYRHDTYNCSSRVDVDSHAAYGSVSEQLVTVAVAHWSSSKADDTGIGTKNRPGWSNGHYFCYSLGLRLSST